MIILTIATAGAPLEWFKFNFLGVAQDQFWYFVGYKANSVEELPLYWGAFSSLLTLAYLLGKVFLVRTQSQHSISYLILSFLLLSTLLAGFIASTGSSTPDYFNGVYRLLLLIIPILICREIFETKSDARLPFLNSIYFEKAKKRAVASLTILICTFIFYSSPSISLQTVFASYESRFYPAQNRFALGIFVPELGGYVTDVYQSYISVGKILSDRFAKSKVPKERRLFSTYTSMLDVLTDSFSPTHSDYLIHALGPRRQEYIDRFKKAAPEYVSTIREDVEVWESWLRRVNWDFYRELLAKYRPYKQTLLHTIWKRVRKKEQLKMEEKTCKVEKSIDSMISFNFSPKIQEASRDSTIQNNEEKTVKVENKPEQLDTTVMYEVAIKYRAVKTRRGIARRLYRQSIYCADGTRFGFNIPANRESWMFLVEIPKGESRSIYCTLSPINLSSFDVESCQVRAVIYKRLVDTPLLPGVGRPFIKTEWVTRG
jgi:hypothetical protein